MMNFLRNSSNNRFLLMTLNIHQKLINYSSNSIKIPIFWITSMFQTQITKKKTTLT